MDAFGASRIAEFKRDGFLFVPASEMWSQDDLKQLIHSVNEMDSWPDQAGKCRTRRSLSIRNSAEFPPTSAC